MRKQFKSLWFRTVLAVRRNLNRSLENTSPRYLPWLATENELLRKALRSSPTWLQGHLLLAKNELAQLEMLQGAKDPRLIAGIRVSAQAAMRLADEDRVTGDDFKKEAGSLLSICELCEKSISPLSPTGSLPRDTDSDELPRRHKSL